MTYPSPAVRQLVAEHFVPVRLLLGQPEHRPAFRSYRVIWTPTIAVIDRRGVEQYQSPGYLPPGPFLGMLQVGLGRGLAAWSRYAESDAQLTAAAADASSPFAAEALFWLGVTRYLASRRRGPLMSAWGRLRAEHPLSAWAARVPPNQEDLDD